MKFCDYCGTEKNTPATYLVTVKYPSGQTVANFVDIVVCEDHAEEVDANVQMFNLTAKGGHFTITKTRINA